MFTELRRLLQYLRHLVHHVQHPLDPADGEVQIARQLEDRQRSFLEVLRRGVFERPGSPYLRLFEHAGIRYEDVAQMIESAGLEAALEHLYDAGVYVTMDEFKGRCPITRPDLEIPVDATSFDNPLAEVGYIARSGGSRGRGLTVPINFDLLRHEGAYMQLYMRAFGLVDRPVALWLSLPPSAPGQKNVLRYAGLGKRVEQWFSHDAHTWSGEGWKFALFTKLSRLAARTAGIVFPAPRFVPSGRAAEVAAWLAEQRVGGQPGVLDTNASSAVHVCLAAVEGGIDIRGSHFRIGAEPLTEGKQRAIKAAGCTAVTHYAMAEIGAIGFACADASSIDDVHLLTDKVAAIERSRVLGATDASVDALVFTTLLASSPKLMLNVESGDYASRENRRCGCEFGRMGFDEHLSGIRSYEKLTSEGVTFLGTELVRLVEDVLPARFGGGPTSYQIVEAEEAGLPTVTVVVSPSIGDVSEVAIVDAVYESLESYPGGELMVGLWRSGNVLRVARREPYQTMAAKILPLHVLERS